MRQSRIFTILALCGAATFGVQAAPAVSFEGTSKKPVSVEAPANSGLNAIFVLDGVAGAKAVFRDSGTDLSQAVWMRYSKLGGGYAEPVAATSSADMSVLDNLEGDMGYIVENGTDRFYFWVVDYSRHALRLDALDVSNESDCQATRLLVSGDAAPIAYYSINGREMELSREMEVKYNTLEFSQDDFTYRLKAVTATASSAEGGSLRVEAPLCETSFTLSGDRFLRAWGKEESVTSPSYSPVAVEAQTAAEQDTERPDNQSGGTSGGLGGSAPAVVTFKAAVTDAAIFREWQFSSYPDFDDIQLRMPDTEVTYTFDELGTTYVRFVCDNAAGTCQFTGPSYDITIGDSSLLCPNAFSPGASEGVNDEWKVSYRSITEFQCDIFNMWGKKMITLKNPSDGWDGRYAGKLVPTGTYYYVIKARGADGKEYKLSGDINILRYE